MQRMNTQENITGDQTDPSIPGTEEKKSKWIEGYNGRYVSKMAVTFGPGQVTPYLAGTTRYSTFMCMTSQSS